MNYLDNEYIVIMAGGVGSRFWPSSRESRPKQFLDIMGKGESLLQATFSRATDIVNSSNVLIVSNIKYKELILHQLPQINESQLLLEPSMNNTAPSVAYTALHLEAINRDAVFAVIPSDHVIENVAVFSKNMKKAFNLARNKDAIVTLGIHPTRPDTGYGYIHYDDSDKGPFFKVKSFKEKPDKLTAVKYLSSGEYLWNAGIFIWSVSTILSAFAFSAPDILSVLETEKERFGTDEEQVYINLVYPKTRSISVDFAILEQAKNIYTIPSNMGWTDLGTWNSLYDFLDKDHTENVVLTRNAKFLNASKNLVKSSNQDKLIVIKGLENYIVVDDDDVLLIYPRDEEQQIKSVRESLKNTPFI